ncbi:MAG: glutamate racemase [Clostridia bacterium]|jgi:glutamate racemase
MIDRREMPIGFFDSGVGGVSVLKEAIRLLPNESFIYFGDNGNAPYGTKPLEQIRRLSMNAATFLSEKGIKALVVACNTATSAAIRDLRDSFSFPIIGMEPALKPAVHIRNNGKIIVMATPATIKQEKFQNLLRKYGKDNEVISLPCPGLVELIEAGKFDSPELNRYLEETIGPFRNMEVDVVVLGCTHYVFIRKHIKAFFMGKAYVIDGNLGTVRQLFHVLNGNNLLIEEENRSSGKVSFYTSGNPEKVLPLFHTLLNYQVMKE